MIGFPNAAMQEARNDWKQGAQDKAWETLTQTLHEKLVNAQTFDILDELSLLPRMMLILDYLEPQLKQGGFIQLFQNGYAPLLLEGTEVLQALQLTPEIVRVFDDALKYFSLSMQVLSRETTVQEFAKLYEQFPEFQPLETVFINELPELKTTLLKRVLHNPQ